MNERTVRIMCTMIIIECHDHRRGVHTHKVCLRTYLFDFGSQRNDHGAGW